MLQQVTLSDCYTRSGSRIGKLPISYRVFGLKLGSAPVVLIHHALTGNSLVAGENGWWKSLVAPGGSIDLNRFTVLSFDIPGNGHNGFLIKDYEAVTLADCADWLLLALDQLGITSVYAGIGGSLGGSLLWQMAVQQPDLFEHIVPIATDWKATDWVLAQCRVQKQILNNSEKPLHDARMHAMTFYRTPQSLAAKFHRQKQYQTPMYLVESWLFHHGQRLEERYHLRAYKLMNHLLMTADIEIEQLKNIQSKIHLIGIDTDGFYLNEAIKKTYEFLLQENCDAYYSVIESIHGHDAFLIEYKQLSKLLQPVFEQVASQKTTKYEHECIR